MNAKPQQLVGESALGRLAEIASQLDAQHIADFTRSLAERVSEGRYYVACVGQFKRGKSTLLNALVGHSILPVGVVPVTNVPTVVRYGARPSARTRLQNADWTEIPVDSVEQYISEQNNPENAKGVTALEIFFPSPLLATGMCFVDTPGLGSVFAANTAATHSFVPHIDAAIVLIGADPPLSGDELQLVESVAEEVHELLFVLNKADRNSDVEREAAIAFARRVLETRLGKPVPAIYEASALERLEQRGPERDWPRFLKALQHLMEQSGHLLVRAAAQRGLRRAAGQLLAIVAEERGALTRPLEESERRMAELQKTLEQAERAMKDLGVLLTAEQQRISEVFAERRNIFLRQSQSSASQELRKRVSSVPQRRSGPAYRRDLNHLAQEVARAQLAPWFESESRYAQEAFGETAKRFIELGNDFLHQVKEIAAAELTALPQELDSEPGLHAESQFRFHLIERVAAPASPLLYLGDLVFGFLGLLGYIVRAAEEFLGQLLEVNSARVQSDVDERVRGSRRKLEAEIRAVLRGAATIAANALNHARAARAAGASAIEASLARLSALENEIRTLLPSE
jgi:GTP-binding protein EngB required for normal cell division